MNEREQKNRREKETMPPIIDGDTRPDMPIDTDEIKAEQANKSKDEVTQNRARDVNSLEDYKDAK